jgi:hypothetical protein
MKKLVLAGSVAALALVTTSCFMLTGIRVTKPVVQPGGSTKVEFMLTPYSDQKVKVRQFVVVGVPDTGDYSIGKATWGVNGTFGGPQAMPAQPGFVEAMVASDFSCAANGLDLKTVTGVQWKAFMTSDLIRTRGLVGTNAKVHATVRVAEGIGGYQTPMIFGATGFYGEDEATADGVVDSSDTFWCTGAGQLTIFVPGSGV